TLVADLLLSLLLLAQFDPAQSGFQFVERHNWIPSLNLHYLVGVDGISILFLPLTLLLFIGVISYSWRAIRNMPRLYYTLMLILATAILGIFMALDSILFFFFWELTLIPSYFLIALWGVGPNRRYAAVKYTLIMLTAGIPLLFGFLTLAFHHFDLSGELLFEYPRLLAETLPAELQTGAFLLLLLGFSFKAPIFPFHTWLPTVVMEGPVGITIVMTGLKLGLYGLIRFAIPLAPDAALDFHWLLAGLATIGIIYGALAATRQTNLRRMLAYASMSHVNLVLLGLASFNIQGIQGALFQLLNFSIISTGTFLIIGSLLHRIGSTDQVSLGGVAKTMPLMGALMFLYGIASMGVPPTSGFSAEFLILVGALKSHTGAGLAALFSIVVAAGYFLSIYRKTFFGPVTSDVVRNAVDLQPRELAIHVLLVLLVLGLGLFPSLVLDLLNSSTTAWLSHLNIS
ncbi:MAG: NADH-quinone oxidoreductase subunit M, partial [Gammaproteobacteria bacterium]|nr:NADH-quinone oxidoreductase subunit M [Gammaproteobacteria bacterium]